MPKIKALLKILPSNQGSINYSTIIQSMIAKSHVISNPATIALRKISKGGIKPFILGASRLGEPEQGGDGHYLWGDENEYRDGKQVGGQVNWYISKEVSDSDGNLTSQAFTIVGTDIDHFTIFFDSITREWATLINIDGIDYENDDAMFVWSGTKSNAHTLTLKKWNKPRFQARILGIVIGLTLELTRNEIKKLVATSRNTYDATKPSNEAISQYGGIEVIDIDRNLLELSQFELLKPQLGVKIFLDASEMLEDEIYEDYAIRAKDYMLGDYLTDSFSGSTASISVAIDLNDELSNWENAYFDGLENHEEYTAETFFNALVESSLVNVNISNETRLVLKSIKIPDGFLPKTGLKEAWDIFCDTTQTRIYKKMDGEIWLI